jgi:hypothetical protein
MGTMSRLFIISTAASLGSNPTKYLRSDLFGPLNNEGIGDQQDATRSALRIVEDAKTVNGDSNHLAYDLYRGKERKTLFLESVNRLGSGDKFRILFVVDHWIPSVIASHQDFEGLNLTYFRALSIGRKLAKLQRKTNSRAVRFVDVGKSICPYETDGDITWISFNERIGSGCLCLNGPRECEQLCAAILQVTFVKHDVPSRGTRLTNVGRKIKYRYGKNVMMCNPFEPYEKGSNCRCYRCEAKHLGQKVPD